MIRSALALLLSALLSPALAQSLTLGDALMRASSRPDALNAQLELLAAETDLLRVGSDPLALRQDQVRAEQSAALARAQLRAAFYGALLEVAQAYMGALEAAVQLELAEAAFSLAESALDIARIRFANGSATQLDVQDAELALAEATANAASARSALAVTEANLSGLVGEAVDAQALSEVPGAFLMAVPPLEDALKSASAHPQRLQAEQGLELARLGVDLLDPSYAPAAQIERARTQLRTTERLVAEVERAFTLQVRNLHLQAETAAEGYRLAQDALRAALERLGTERRRLDAGLIAQVQFRQAELQAAQAELAALQAEHRYLAALLQLQAGAGVQLAGPEALDFARVRERLATEAVDDGD